MRERKAEGIHKLQREGGKESEQQGLKDLSRKKKCVQMGCRLELEVK